MQWALPEDSFKACSNLLHQSKFQKLWILLLLTWTRGTDLAVTTRAYPGLLHVCTSHIHPGGLSAQVFGSHTTEAASPGRRLQDCYSIRMGHAGL